MIEEADRDNSGAIDFREFCSLMVKREREKETTEDIKQAFRVFDKVNWSTDGLILTWIIKDGNGYVSTSELKFVMNKLNVFFTEQVSYSFLKRFSWLLFQDLQEIFLEADIDGDGHSRPLQYIV